jgi:glycosyltransferase involved in cell wall biosynthesis
MIEPRFSVVIPTCDRPEYLREAVESVLAQSVSAHEILVIDNGQEAVDPNQLPNSSKLRVIRALPRFGVSQARNLGAILASGDFIAFLDDDDCWDKGYLKAVCMALEETSAEIVLGRLRDGKTGEPVKGKQADFTDRDDLIWQIFIRNPGAVGSNTTIKRTRFTASAGYDPWLTTGQDKALVLDLLLQGVYAVRASSAWVEFRNDGVGARQTEIPKRIQGKKRFLRKYWSQMNGYQRLFNVVQIIRLHQKYWFG